MFHPAITFIVLLHVYERSEGNRQSDNETRGRFSFIKRDSRLKDKLLSHGE